MTTILALVIIDKVGRKKLVYYGVSGMVVSLILIGLYFLFGDSLNVSSLFLLVFFLFYVFCCAVSICAVVFVLLSEMYPTKVRGLAMSIAGYDIVNHYDEVFAEFDRVIGLEQIAVFHVNAIKYRSKHNRQQRGLERICRTDI